MIHKRKKYKKNSVKKRYTFKDNRQLIPIGKTNIHVGTSKAEKEWLIKLNVPIHSQVIYGLRTVGNRRQTFVVDGFDPKTNTCFEYNGNRYHGGEGYPHHKYDPTLKKTYGELYLKTLYRYQVLFSLGFKIFRVWESHYKRGFLGGFWKPGDPV